MRRMNTSLIMISQKHTNCIKNPTWEVEGCFKYAFKSDQMFHKLLSPDLNSPIVSAIPMHGNVKMKNGSRSYTPYWLVKTWNNQLGLPWHCDTHVRCSKETRRAWPSFFSVLRLQILARSSDPFFTRCSVKPNIQRGEVKLSQFHLALTSKNASGIKRASIFYEACQVS